MSYTFNIRIKHAIFKRNIAVILMLAILLPLGGCQFSLYANYREISTLQLVQTMGIDTAKDGVTVTISTGEGLPDQPSAIISRSGKSIISAMESIQDYSAKEELFFSHIKYVVVGEEAAQKILPSILDYIERSTELRMDITMFVVKDGTAKSLITETGGESMEITSALSSVERDTKKRGPSYPFNCCEIPRTLAEYGSTLVCAVKGVKTEGSIYSEKGAKMAIPTGYAIIKDGKLCGYLDKEDSQGATILLNKSGRNALVLPDGKGGNVTTFPDKAKTKVSARWGEDGKLKQIIIDIKVIAAISELDNLVDVENPEYLDFLTSELNKEIKNHCDAALFIAQDLKSDFLGLAGTIRRHYPKKYSKLPENFEEALANAEIIVNVESEVSRTFDMNQPADVSGEGIDHAK